MRRATGIGRVGRTLESTMFRILLLSPAAVFGVACAASDPREAAPDPDAQHAMLLAEARGASFAPPTPEAAAPERVTGSRRDFHRRLVGLWHVKTFQQTPDGSAQAWVDLYWIIGRQYAMHVVTLYADEALTIPLLR